MKYFLSIVFFTLSFNAFSQLKEGFVIQETSPEFIGGIPALFKFLGQNVRYPKESREKGNEGTVYINFVVNELGDIENVTVKNSSLTQRTFDEKEKKWIYTPIANDELLCKEAARVVALMPRWKPGMGAGKPIKVNYTLPIKFVL